MSQVFCILDYETFSEADLKSVGGWEYSVHPSTEILCAAFRIGTRESLPKAKTELWVPSSQRVNEAFANLLRSFRNPEIDLVAHNAIFEQMITRNVFATKHMSSKISELQSIPIDRWHCTAAMSRAYGLPGSLEAAGQALQLKVQKDPEGKKLVRELCMPKKPTKKNPSTRNTNPEKLAALAEYCVRDVDTEVELFLKVPKLHPKDRRFWVLNQTMNLRGFAVDRELTKGALTLISLETKRLDQRAKILSGGKLESARQNAELLKWLKTKGVMLSDLRANTIAEFLDRIDSNKAMSLPDVLAKARAVDAIEMLRIRQSVSRSSTGKWLAFEARSRSDGRCRDNVVFFGAHTGRDAGTGVQPQNLPSISSPSFKSGIKQSDIDAGLELIRRCDIDTIHALYPSLMELLAGSLRSCIVAKPGHLLEVGDWATVEVRKLFWMAGETQGLKDLAEGAPIYSDMAGLIYGESGAKIEAGHKAGKKDDSRKRQLGKQVVLGGGFGIGVGGEKFQLTAKQYGMDISLELAQRAVKAYRAKYKRVVAFWGNLERAAIWAVQNPSKAHRVGYVVWKMEGTSLTVKLPIGRKLYYPFASVKLVNTLYGPKPQLSYRTLITPKMWGRVTTWGGKLAENVVQASCRDLLYEGIDALEQAGHRPVLPVHDEVVAETPKEKASHKEMERIMTAPLPWAKDFPLKAEAWAEPRYRK